MTRFTAPVLALCAALPMASAAMAEEPAAIPMTYEMFEQGVSHLDMAVCPVPLAGPERFCRVSAQSEMLNVFVFSENGDQPLIGYQSWPADLLNGLMD